MLNADAPIPTPRFMKVPKGPHMGLVDVNGVELDNETCHGYHRVDLDSVDWKIKLIGNLVCFANKSPVSFGMAHNLWTPIHGFKVYAGPMKGSDELSEFLRFGKELHLEVGESVYFEVGNMTFYWKDMLEKVNPDLERKERKDKGRGKYHD